MTPDRECASCSDTSDVMKRQVGSQTKILCAKCADRQRALHGQPRASQSPDKLNTVSNHEEEGDTE